MIDNKPTPAAYSCLRRIMGKLDWKAPTSRGWREGGREYYYHPGQYNGLYGGMEGQIFAIIDGEEVRARWAGNYYIDRTGRLIKGPASWHQAEGMAVPHG